MTEPLDILYPERHLTIAGVDVKVHEYTLGEQLRHRGPIRAVSNAFHALFATAPPDAEIEIGTIVDVMSEHSDDVLQLVAVSCGQSVEWVEKLAGNDADDLLMMWWSVNSGFFIRTALQPEIAAILRQRTMPSTGDRLPPNSLATAISAEICKTTPSDS